MSTLAAVPIRISGTGGVSMTGAWWTGSQRATIAAPISATVAAAIGDVEKVSAMPALHQTLHRDGLWIIRRVRSSNPTVTHVLTCLN